VVPLSQPAPSGRARAGAAAGPSALDAVTALGSDDQAVAKLVQRLTPSGDASKRGGGGGGGKGAASASTDYWALQSAVEAVDMVLWSFVDRPGGEGEEGPCFLSKGRCTTNRTMLFWGNCLYKHGEASG
jgi:hypothetical protein